MMGEKLAGTRKFTGYLAKKSTTSDKTIKDTHWLYYRDKLTRAEKLKFWE